MKFCERSWSIHSEECDVCDELCQYGDGDTLGMERKPVQLVVLIQESKAKEGRIRGGRVVIGELPLNSLQVTY